MKRGSLIVMFSITFGLGLVKHLQRACTVSKNTIYFDTFLSSGMQEEIRTFFESGFKDSINRADNRADLAQQAKKRFFCIKDITWEHKSSHRAIMHIRARSPLYTLNKQSLFLEDGLVEAKSNFTEESTEHLYNLSVAFLGDCVDETLCNNLLAQRLDNLFEHFSVTWVDASNIVLTDKSCSYFCLRTHAYCILDQSVIEECFQLRDELKTQARPKATVWVADVRFDNQIILYGQRGNNEGKSIL